MSEFNFMTAQQARERSRNSEAAVQKWLKGIEPLIIKAADQNQNHFTLFLDAVDITYSPKLPELSPEIMGGVKLLKELGYSVRYTTYGDRYVPAGMRDNDGNGPLHQNYGLIIGW